MVIIKLEISIYEIAVIIFSVVGGVFALLQWRKSQKLKRAELVKDLLTKLRDDKEIAQALYRIDYGDTWYTRKFLENHDEEEHFDRAFAHIDFICYLYRMGLIDKEEFQIFEYRIRRIAANRSVQDYFFNLFHFAKRNGTQISFPYLLEYLDKNKLLREGFHDKTSLNFNRLLNL